MPSETHRLKVGMLASLTGQFSDQGRQALAGASAWVNDANARGGIQVASYGRKLPVELTHYDDRSTAHIARAWTEKLILDDQVDLLLGPYSSSLTLAAMPEAERLQRVLWNHGGASDQVYAQGSRWVVGILTPASGYLHGILDLVKEGDPAADRTVAIIHSARGSFPAAVASGVESYAEEAGFQVVFTTQYRSPSADFPPILQALQERKPDIILGVGRIEEDILLAKQIVRSGVSVNAIALVAAGIGQFREALGDAATGFLGPSQWEPGAGYQSDYGPSAQELAQRYQAFGPGGGDYAMAQAYAAGLVAQKCVEDTGTLDNVALRETADRLDFTTFYGRFKLEPGTGCQIGHSVSVVQWQGEQKIIVWPKELRQADPIYPSHPPR